MHRANVEERRVAKVLLFGLKHASMVAMCTHQPEHVLALCIWRDSVCLADDCEAPHELSLSLPLDASLGHVTDQIIRRSYLASIAGGRATWILEARRPLAVFAQQWSQPRFLLSPDVRLTSIVDLAATPHLQFRYWCQVDPNIVFGCLQHEQPLPDMYGR